MPVIRWFAVVGLVAIALGAAPAAQADIQLYYGRWIAQSFGNDITFNGDPAAQTESSQWEVLGIPLGNLCNAIQPRCPFSQTGANVTLNASTPLTPKRFDPLAAFCRPNSDWGLLATRPVKGATVTTGGAFKRPIPPVYRVPTHFTAGGAGRTTACSDATTVMGGKATAAPLTMQGYLEVVELAPVLEIVMPAEEEKEAAVRADGELADEMAAWDAASDRDFLDFEEGLLEGDA